MALAALRLALWLLPSGLTAVGARTRGQPLLPALLAGLAWPLTWAVWYVRDGEGEGVRP